MTLLLNNCNNCSIRFRPSRLVAALVYNVNCPLWIRETREHSIRGAEEPDTREPWNRPGEGARDQCNGRADLTNQRIAGEQGQLCFNCYITPPVSDFTFILATTSPIFVIFVP